MPEQANHISSGPVPFLKAATPGKSQAWAGAETIRKSDSAFSRDMDQARQQQLHETRSDSSPRGSARNGSSVSDAETQSAGRSKNSTQSSTSNARRASQDLPRDESATDDATGKTISIETVDSETALLTAPDQQLPVAVKQGSVSAELPGALQTSAALLDTGKADPVFSPVTAQLPEPQSRVAGALKSGSAGELLTPATLAGQSRQTVTGGQVISNAEPQAADSLTTFSVLSAADDTGDKSGRLLKESIIGGSEGKPATEKGTTSAAMAKAGVYPDGEAGSAVMTALQAPVAVQTDKAGLTPTSVAGLTQLAASNGIVTQATLAGRFRNLSSGVASPVAETTPTAFDTGLAQAIYPTLNAGGRDGQPVGNKPLTGEPMSGMESLMGLPEQNTTVHQRIAATEAMLSQMAMESDDASVKMATADNLLPVISGNTVSAPVVTQSVPTAAPIAQAPLNIPLTSADAETALAGNVKWMTTEGVKNAVMTVTPHGMGPISVKIGIEGGQMDVSIIASQHSTRDALESMLPRLREQLAVQGHESVKVDVSDGKSEQSRSGNGQGFAESRNPAGASPQDNPSNGSNHGEKKEYGRSNGSEQVSESFMAEDLQRVAARVIGEADGRSGFDAYV